ncbi:tetratricopeptide repeat protein [Streptomyces erythrochromogenes]|uniref:Tetratricopeptide repeat protein n=1 Tax=Streptomyces erythrochromogenes TaxID=285574 RepID=A0ABZ1Q393_9ACTN|nr:tetratricopeptide repeat protein [Streptomyces erythrochromogenes]
MGRKNKGRRKRAKTTGAGVSANKTGNAAATSAATATTGYQGPAPRGGSAPGSVHLSGTGNATGSDGALVNTGYVHQMNVEKLTLRKGSARDPAAWPHQVGVVPSSARSFQQRAEADRLRDAVDGGGTAVLSQVLTGMGGVGKTQLAADYARTAWNDSSLDVLVWITASTQSAVVSGYAQAGVELCRADPANPEQAAKQFLAWLAHKPGQRPCRWLVVLDDVADPGDLIVGRDDPARCYSLWPPAGPHGRTLLTTRRRDAALFGEGRRRIDVSLFTADESLAYLTASLNSQGRTEPADQLAALAHDLGHLPLALAQAAAYIVDSGESAAVYRYLLADRATTLTDLTPESLPDEQATALAAAWSLSIDRADTLRPVGLARPMLHLAALLDANGIPQVIVSSPSARTHLAAHRTPAGPTHPWLPKWWPGRRWRPLTPVSPKEAQGALRALDRLSLIDHQPGTPHQVVRVHQLIQHATRDTLTPNQHYHTARTAADALMDTWPKIERDTDLARMFRTNADALTRHAEDALYSPDAHPVLYRLGISLGESGQVTAAIDHFRSLVTTCGSSLGEDHPNTLTARNNLAAMRGNAWDTADAVQALTDLVESMVRVRGTDHPDTLTARNNLAAMRGEAGDAAGAAQALTDLLESMVRVLGPNHYTTLTARGNLASWQGRAGDEAGAVQALTEVVESMVRVLGPDHPTTLTMRNNLAGWRGEAGDAAGAAQALTELLADRIRVLGEGHPDTLDTRSHLAARRGEAGDAAGAAQALTDLLELLERVLEPDHGTTLTARTNLAAMRWRAGDATGALQALTDLHECLGRVLGEDHRTTRSVRATLADMQRQAGDEAEVVQATLTDLLESLGRIQGSDGFEVLIVREDLGHGRRQA